MTTVTISTPKLHDSFTANNELHQILGLGFAFSNDYKPALTSADFTGLDLHNYTVISNSDDGLALYFTKHSTGSITNEASGLIQGGEGVRIMSTGVTLHNYGTIKGFNVSGPGGIYIQSPAHNDLIDNHGTIFSAGTAIDNNTFVGTNSIRNAGTIEGGYYGIGLDSSHGLKLNVLNNGTIKGGYESFFNGGGGRLLLTNHGLIIGKIDLVSNSALDKDIIHNSGTISGNVVLGGGADTFENYSAGTSGAVYGQAGADRLVGGASADRLNGGGDNDHLGGHGGNDTLTGGAGGDTFEFGSQFNVAGVDKVTDFAHGIDKIELDSSIFSAANDFGTLQVDMFFEGSAAHDATDRIIYNAANGWLTYDSNGSAAGGSHHFATLAPHLILTNTDFLMLP